ncbi:MAG: hypothetical protein UR60_C0039G0010, partial [Candidatus Moranbacteria bacterium GW2011_GWF2_34_56]
AIPIIKSEDLTFYNMLKSIVETNVIEKQIIECKKIIAYYMDRGK